MDENVAPNRYMKGKSVRICGRLESMSQREARKLVRESGGTFLPADDIETPADWLIVGEQKSVFNEMSASDTPPWLTQRVRKDIECGVTRLATEQQFLQLLFPPGAGEKELTSLYTLSMLAELLNLPVSEVRRWYVRGLIEPARVVRRLAYFDLEEFFSARRLASLAESGAKIQSVERKLNALKKLRPDSISLLRSADLVIRGRDVLLRTDGELVESTGQLVLDFEEFDRKNEEERLATSSELAPNLEDVPQHEDGVPSFDLEALEAWDRFLPSLSFEELDAKELRDEAQECETNEDWAKAEELYRNALFIVGANAEDAFALGRTLYRQRNLYGARERFSMALELDEDHFEARALLGAVLGELGETELAIAALKGAIETHERYADAHLHLARVWKRVGDDEKAREEYRLFLQNAQDPTDEQREEAENSNESCL
ncbi:MAG: MerR family transcriptional regulator [Planctomycetia bacterium]|nr:MerR family transcriptional regulator [Planctomycetia bacterium]